MFGSNTGSAIDESQVIGGMVSSREAARVLSCTLRWIEYLVEDGELRGRIVARRLFVDTASLQEYVERLQYE